MEFGSSATSAVSQSEQREKPSRYSALHSGQNMTDGKSNTFSGLRPISTTYRELAMPVLAEANSRSEADVRI